MDIQVRVPKIKLNHSRAQSHNPSPRPTHHHRSSSQGELETHVIQSERLGGTNFGNINNLPNSKKTLTVLITHVPHHKIRHKRNISSNLLLPKKGEDSINKIETEKVEVLGAEEPIQSQRKMSISRATTDRSPDQTGSSINKISDKGTDGATDRDVANKAEGETKLPAQKKAFQKIVTLAAKALSNLDDLVDDDLLELAIQILKKPPAQRVSNEIKVLARCMATVEFFKKYDQDTIESCLKHMYYVSLTKGENVFQAGTVGTNFWVTVKGSVSVIVDLPKVVGKNDKGEDIIEKRPTEVRVLPAGSAFGELALMNSKPRAATIACKEDCEFAVLEKGPFKEILNEKEKKLLAIQLEFLGSVPALKTLPYHLVHWLYYNSESIKKLRGQVVYEEGEPCRGIYIIKSGEFRVLKTVDEVDMEPSLKDPSDKMRKKQATKKTVELAILGQKEIFGEDEILAGNAAKRKYTIVCSSQAEIRVVPREALEKKLLNVVALRNWIINYSEGKENYYAQRLKMIRETRSDQNSNILDKSGVSSLRQYHPSTNSTDYSKHCDTTNNSTNPEYIKRSMEESMKLVEKKKAFLAMQGKFATPPRIPRKQSQGNQSFKLESDGSRSKGEVKDKLTLKTANDQIDFQNNKLSLMRVNLDMLKSKKRFTRRSESFSRRLERSPKKASEDDTNREKSGNRRQYEESFSNSMHHAFRAMLVVANDTKINPLSSIHVKHLNSSLLEGQISDEITKRKTTDRSYYEKVVLKTLGSSMHQYSATLDSFKIDSNGSVPENKYSSMLYNKAVEKVSWDSKHFETKRILPFPSHAFLGPKTEDNEDIQTYLLNKLNSRSYYFGKNNHTEGNQLREDASFSVSSSSNHFRGIEGKAINSRRELRVMPKTSEDEDSYTRSNSKSHYHPHIAKSRRDL